MNSPKLNLQSPTSPFLQGDVAAGFGRGVVAFVLDTATAVPSRTASASSAPSPEKARDNMNLVEAADHLRISTKTLLRETSARRVRVARIGRRLVYRKVDLDRYLELKVLAG